jgi:Membrane bound O-acyl transferase family
MLFNFRRIVDSNQRDVKKFKGETSATEKKPSNTSTPPKAMSSRDRTKYFLKQLILALAFYAIYYFYHKIFTPWTVNNLLQQLPHSTPLPTLKVYFRRIPYTTLPETLLRIFAVVDFILATYLIDNFFHAIFSLTFVSILQLDSSIDWPPLFGSLSATYGLRTFWSLFWHRLVAPTYLSYASLITCRILRIDPRSTTGKHLMTFWVFFISGIAHALVTWHVGFRCGWWQDLWWFCANAVGILVEEVVKAAVEGILGWKALRMVSGLERPIGYVWTWGFLFWSVPKWQYPKMICGIGR